MCTHTQRPNFNVHPCPPPTPPTNQPNEAFELQILPNSDVLVADSNADIVLDPNGNVLQTYTCASLPGCQGALFAVASTPSGTSFWTGDSNSGYIWQVDTGHRRRHADDQHASGSLYGLSVDDQIEVAAAPTVVAATPDALAVQPGLGQLLLAHAGLGGLDGLVDRHAHRERAGDLHPQRLRDVHRDHRRHRDGHLRHHAGEPSSSYTLTASFSGDTSSSTPIGSDSTSSTFTVNPDTSSVTYTGPTTAVNGAADHAVGHAHHEHADAGHAAADQGGDLHRRLGLDLPVLQRHDGRQRERQLHHHRRRPAGQRHAGHDELRRRRLRHADRDHDVDDRHRADDTHGQFGHGRLLRRHHGLGRADGLGDQRTRSRASP